MTAKWRHAARFQTHGHRDGSLIVRGDAGLDGAAIACHLPYADIYVRVTLAELAGIADMLAKALASAEADAAEAELQKGAGDVQPR